MTRHYTTEEANNYIPMVEPVLRDAVRLKREYDQALEHRLPEELQDDDDHYRNAERLLALRKEIGDRLGFMTALSIQVKDLDVGLIDFPTIREGREVLLCWHLGEAEVTFWHTLGDGFPGRKPV